ncbi:MAG: LLM class F420-dependent oxidoreductase [Roseiflexaceae bacterium]
METHMTPFHPFRFGVINEQMLPREQWMAHVRQIEAHGYDIFLIRDHVVDAFFGEQYGPLVAMATAAAITTRLHVGSMVICNDFRHPVLLAREAATLAELSGGRCELGIGAGWLKQEYEQAGLPFERAGSRIERLGEAIAVLRGLWSGQPYSMAGQFYQIDRLHAAPIPRQPIPILIGGGQQRMLTMAGALADMIGILTTSVASGTLKDDLSERMPAAVQQKLDWVRAGAGDAYDRRELGLIPTVVLSDDRLAATLRLIEQRGWDLTPEQVWELPSVLIGSVAEICATLIERRKRYGFSYYIVSDSAYQPFADVVERMRQSA